jgi:menaquinol-cytochrome c reductase iron-sulfur subunit
VEPRPGDDKPHLPSPSIWPVGFAVGIATTLAGLVVSWPAAVVGAIIAVIFGALWARDAMASSRAPAEGAVLASTDAALAEPEPEDEVERFPRNRFLEYSTLGLGAVIAGVVTLPVLGFAVLPAFTDQEHPGVDLGPTDNFPEGEFIEATFMLDPALGEVTRRTTFVRYNGLSGDLPSYTVLSNHCVHLGCPVQASGPRNENQKKTVKVGDDTFTLTPILPANFSCPCHGGAYDTEGNRIAGPPVRALDRYKFSIINGHLVLIEVYSVAKVEGEGADAKIEAYGRQGPGEHVDGLEGWMYPLSPQDVEG